MTGLLTARRGVLAKSQGLVLARYDGSALTAAATAAGITAGTMTNSSLTTMIANSTQGYTHDPVFQETPASTATTAGTVASTSSYLSITISAATAIKLNAVLVRAGRGGSTTARGMTGRTSQDAYGSLVNNTQLPGSFIASQRPVSDQYTFDLSSYAAATSITFRLGFFGPNTTASIDFDDIVFLGTIA